MKMKIRNFMSRYIRNYEFGDDEDIFANGLVNSLFSMQLIMFLEKEFDVEIEMEDIDVANFRTLNLIADLLERKLATAKEPV